MERLGLGYEALARGQPGARLRARSAATAPTGRAPGGRPRHQLPRPRGRAERDGAAPAISGVQIADLAGGSLLGVAGLLAALVRAQRTGEGDHVDIAMTDGAFALQALGLGAYFAGRRAERSCSTGRFPCYALYECADGRYVTVGALEPPFWRELCDGRRARPISSRTQFDPRRAHDVARALPDEIARRVARAARGPRRLRRPGQRPQRGDRRPAAAPSRDGRSSSTATPQLGTPIKLRNAPGELRTPAPRLGDATREIAQPTGTGASPLSQARSPIRSRQVSALRPLIGPQQRAVEREQGLQALDLVLVERAQHAPGGRLAVAVPDDQLRDHRVVVGQHGASRPRRRSRRARTGRRARGSGRSRPARGRSSSTRPRR